MKCPYCGSLEDKVVASRLSSDGDAIRRRRECTACERRYTTYERVESDIYRVVKKDQRRVPFSRQKLLEGMLKACEKRPVALAVLEKIADEVESMLVRSRGRELHSDEIGELVMSRLRELDEVAYVRFASVYRRFRDIEEFQRELEGLQRQKRRGD